MMARAPAGTRSILAVMMFLSGFPFSTSEVQAMSIDQFKKLAGATLLDMRVDAVLQRCGLPAAIVDTGDVRQQGRKARWGDARMVLSPMTWELRYVRQRNAAIVANGWSNPDPASSSCLPGLTQLVLQAKGGVGFLSVKKKPDNQGYTTTYRVPDNLFRAHQVAGLTASWIRGMPVSRIHEQFGKPDEVLKGEGGTSRHRYWVIVRQQEMPVSAYAVDFETTDKEWKFGSYTVYTSDASFVQERFDALAREWEKTYVLD